MHDVKLLHEKTPPMRAEAGQREKARAPASSTADDLAVRSAGRALGHLYYKLEAGIFELALWLDETVRPGLFSDAIEGANHPGRVVDDRARP